MFNAPEKRIPLERENLHVVVAIEGTLSENLYFLRNAEINRSAAVSH
jgi:hypothetical protein